MINAYFPRISLKIDNIIRLITVSDFYFALCLSVTTALRCADLITSREALRVQSSSTGSSSFNYRTYYIRTKILGIEIFSVPSAGITKTV